MSDTTDEIRSWGSTEKPGLRFLAELIRYLVAVGTDTAGSALSLAQADTLDATAEGFDAIAQAADDAVENPDL